MRHALLALSVLVRLYSLIHRRLESAIPLLLRRLKTLEDSSDVSIAFPDDGATKRFGDMFNEYKTITCAKVRNGDQRIVVVKDGKY